jgi:hypothetical protein
MPLLRYRAGVTTHTLDDYIAHETPPPDCSSRRGDTILVERYQYRARTRHRFTSFSMAKTVTAMLIGVAIAEGPIRSVDDLAAAYVPGSPTPSTGARRSATAPDVLGRPLLRELLGRGRLRRGSSSRRSFRTAPARSRGREAL